jgi:hypothetical protein
MKIKFKKKKKSIVPYDPMPYVPNYPLGIVYVPVLYNIPREVMNDSYRISLLITHSRMDA